MENKHYYYEFKAKNIHLDGFEPKYELEYNDKGLIIIYKDGIKRLINVPAFMFVSATKLTKKDALYIIKGTKGFEISKGDFKEEVSNNKYYTPKLEEFHLGFEHEHNCVLVNDMLASEYGQDEWVSDIYGVKDNLKMTQKDIEFGFKRVKYLDATDIEELGFVEEYNNYFTIQAPGNIGYWTEIIIDFRWNSNTGGIIIKGKRGSEQETIFNGTVKNKSELKRILTQLCVL